MHCLAEYRDALRDLGSLPCNHLQLLRIEWCVWLKSLHCGFNQCHLDGGPSDGVFI